MTGGQHTVAASAKQLDSSDSTAYKQITIRSNTGNAVLYFGGSNVTAVPANAHGFLNAEESWTFGPFSPGVGLKPTELYVIGTAGNILFWSGIPA